MTHKERKHCITAPKTYAKMGEKDKEGHGKVLIAIFSNFEIQ